MVRINDVGERALVQRIKSINDARGTHKLFYDDASPIDIPKDVSTVWITTDPSPLPCLVHLLGMGNYYHSGWLLAVKSISDISSMGALPLGLLVACEFNNQMSLSDFDDFFHGVIDCVNIHGCSLIGGNVKETPKSQHGVAFALGYCKYKPLIRGNVDAGDIVFVIDKQGLGSFWAAIAVFLNPDIGDCLSDKDRELLLNSSLCPMAYVDEGTFLAEMGCVKFCMDSSDGLLASLVEIAKTSTMKVRVNMNMDRISDSIHNVCQICGGDLLLWVLGWGSYHLVCVASQEVFPTITEKAKRRNYNIIKIGDIIKGESSIEIHSNNKLWQINEDYILSLEQFTKTRFSIVDINDYVQFVLDTKLQNVARTL